jgi:hypothetical protein
MAIYHLNMSVISRKAGRSATASAAYRSGERIIDERTGEVHDYRRKHGVSYTELVTPDGAPAWAHDRAALWNAVEHHNRRADAIVAREINLALPHELSATQRQDLARDFAQQIATRYQVAVDLAIHQPNGQDPRNHHAHLLLTTNRLEPAGLGTKARELDPIATAKAGPGKNAVEQLRQEWARQANHALERAGHAHRIDHRTLEAQGLERLPQIHHGPTVAALEQRGIRTERGDLGRAIERHNARLIDLHTQRRDLDLQLNAGEARDQFRGLWQQHQAEQARQRQVQELADKAAAEFRRQVETQRQAEPTRDRERKRELEHDVERERKRERNGPSLGR